MILYSPPKLGEAQYHWRKPITLRSNRTRRKAIITEKAMTGASQSIFSDIPAYAGVILLRSDIFADAKVVLYSPKHWAKPNITGVSQYHCVAIELAARRI